MLIIKKNYLPVQDFCVVLIIFNNGTLLKGTGSTHAHHFLPDTVYSITQLIALT